MKYPGYFFLMSQSAALKKRLLAFKGTESGLALEALNDNAQLIADANKIQLEFGIKTDGQKSDFKYAASTIALKKKRSGIAGITNHLTNFDTGESYEELFAEFKPDHAIFGTKTDKEQAIIERMDGKAFGLTDDNKKILMQDEIKKSFIQKVRTFLYGK